jgi:hypothetical protein
MKAGFVTVAQGAKVSEMPSKVYKRHVCEGQTRRLEGKLFQRSVVAVSV